MARNSIGLIELGSIAAGFQVSDAMLKAADVELVLARTICSGKYMVLIGGETAEMPDAYGPDDFDLAAGSLDLFLGRLGEAVRLDGERLVQLALAQDHYRLVG